jgi:hypothetical protein
MVSPHAPAAPAFAALCGALVACVPAAMSATEGKRTFDLPRGDAALTLKQFAAAGLPIVYLVDRVRGATTNAVRGEFTPREALEQMLAGSGLEAAQDAATGAFVVSRQRRARPPAQTGEVGTVSNPQPKPQGKPMKSHRTLLATLAGWLALLTPIDAQTAASAPQGVASSQETGTVRGRVQNVASGQYLNNARVSELAHLIAQLRLLLGEAEVHRASRPREVPRPARLAPSVPGTREG